MGSKVEEETGKEEHRKENSPEDIDKTSATPEAILMRLSWGKIFSLLDQRHQHMVTAL